jgi:hypothetical protein
MSSLASASQGPAVRPQERFTTASGGRDPNTAFEWTISQLPWKREPEFPICHANGPPRLAALIVLMSEIGLRLRRFLSS